MLVLKTSAVIILEKTISMLSDKDLKDLSAIAASSTVPINVGAELMAVCCAALPAVQSAAALQSLRDDIHLDIRRSTYVILYRACTVFPREATRDVSVLRLLFSLMDNEDERIISNLFTALGALRVAYESGTHCNCYVFFKR